MCKEFDQTDKMSHPTKSDGIPSTKVPDNPPVPKEQPKPVEDKLPKVHIPKPHTPNPSKPKLAKKGNGVKEKPENYNKDDWESYDGYTFEYEYYSSYSDGSESYTVTESTTSSTAH